MSELKLEFVGKQVKDMYGTFMGKVVGIITDTDGSIESVGVDCGSAGLKQLPYEQLLVQGDYVIYIPRWRLDAQKLLRQKNLTLQRIKGLQDIVAENDLMKDDAELVYLKYEKRLNDLGEIEKSVNDKLQARLNELDTENRSIKTVLFDAKLQFRSNEITEEAYQQISTHTNELIEHITIEKSEINNVKTRLTQQTLENIALMPRLPTTISTSNAKVATEDSLAKQLESKLTISTPQPVNSDATGYGAPDDSPIENSNEGKVITKTTKRESDSDASWLNQVIQNE
ncbi:MAG TPA: CdvA-like protein [Candidatus Nitrosopolaris sp.]|nr:CdvA-like protein [Candidatus Nitrosopolaris sp.]